MKICFFLVFLADSTSALMTFPKADKLLLMFAPSFSVAPLAPVDFALSLPAKSTKLTLANMLLLSSVASFW